MSNLLKFILAVLYVISPIDLVPEMFFGPIGLIDDFAVLIALIVFYGIKFITKDNSSAKVKKTKFLI